MYSNDDPAHSFNQSTADEYASSGDTLEQAIYLYHFANSLIKQLDFSGNTLSQQLKTQIAPAKHYFKVCLTILKNLDDNPNLSMYTESYCTLLEELGNKFFELAVKHDKNLTEKIDCLKLANKYYQFAVLENLNSQLTPPTEIYVKQLNVLENLSRASKKDAERYLILMDGLISRINFDKIKKSQLPENLTVFFENSKKTTEDSPKQHYKIIVTPEKSTNAARSNPFFNDRKENDTKKQDHFLKVPTTSKKR